MSPDGGQTKYCFLALFFEVNADFNTVLWFLFTCAISQFIFLVIFDGVKFRTLHYKQIYLNLTRKSVSLR